MVEGAKSFFKSTASEIDDKNLRALSNTESYTILNLIVPQAINQNCRTFRAVQLVEERSFSIDKPYF
jgi:hypothetical protein